jgi:serine/threonine protein phosphatase PrpC
VDADPDVLVRPTFTDIEWLIIASDGLWHLMDNKDVIRMAAGQLTAEVAAAKLMSEIDTNTRSQLKGHDNTVILAIRTHTGVVPVEYRVKQGTL